MVGIGIDFGTSNSSVVLFDGERLEVLAVEPGAPDPAVMPTALYLSRDKKGTIGQAGIDRYLRENAGRRITLEREHVGTIELTLADTDYTQQSGPSADGLEIEARVHAYTDAGLPGRLFRGVKRWLGATGLEHVRVFGEPYRIVALITPVLAHLGERARAHGDRSTDVRVGRPVHYERSASVKEHAADSLAARRMRESCGYAGLQAFELFPEPVAAALPFLERERDRSGEIVLSFDFGGGTLDLALVRSTRGGVEVLATHGLGLGGDAINRDMYRRFIFPEIGEGLERTLPVEDREVRAPFPFDRFADRLLNWPLAYELNQPALCEVIAHAMREGPEARRRLARLRGIVEGNLAYAVFLAIERCKVALSSADRASIRLDEIDLDVEVTRAAFEHSLAPVLTEIDACVDAVLLAAGVSAADVGVVVRTGGSSRIPAVVDRLAQRFPDRVLEQDAFTSIAAGLALASFRGEAFGGTRPGARVC